jgi:inosine-uridine nucleoside N-ribohydrolase
LPWRGYHVMINSSEGVGDNLSFLIDCDPGHDDAIAILYANACLDLIGITTVFGNSSIENTTHNALSICTLSGISVPVAKGAGNALKGYLVNGTDVHGSTGLDGADMPVPDREIADISASDFIIEASYRYTGKLIIIATGPLTNIATALQSDPSLASRLAGISIMGGSTGVGNVTPVAEINVFADPEAAQIVLGSKLPIWIVGLSVTTTVGANIQIISKLQSSGGRVAGTIAELLIFYLGAQMRLYGRNIAPFHDVCAVLPFVSPQMIEHKDAHVVVELDGKHTRGMTVTDFRNIPNIPLAHLHSSQPANAKVAISANGSTAVPHILDTIIRTYDGGIFPAN